MGEADLSLLQQRVPDSGDGALADLLLLVEVAVELLAALSLELEDSSLSH